MVSSGVNVVLVLLVAVVVATVVGALAVARSRRMRNPGRPTAPVAAFPQSGSGWWSLGLAVGYLLALQGLLSLDWADPLGTTSPGDWISKILLFGMAVASLILGASSWRTARSVLVSIGMIVLAWVGLVPLIGSLFFE